MAPNEELSLTQFSARLRQAAVPDVQCEEPRSLCLVPPVLAQEQEEEGGPWTSKQPTLTAALLMRLRHWPGFSAPHLPAFSVLPSFVLSPQIKQPL